MQLKQYLLLSSLISTISGAALGNNENFDVGPEVQATSFTHYDPLSAISPLPTVSSISIISSVETTSASGKATSATTKATSAASIHVYSGLVITGCLLSVLIS